MTSDPVPSDDSGMPPEMVQLLRQLLGDSADDAIRALQESGFDASAMMRAAGLGDGAGMQHLFAQAQAMFLNPGSGPVNWRLAHDLARQTALAEGGDPTLTDSERRLVTDALMVAELWIDGATSFDSSGATARALSRAEWVETTLDAWKSMSEPIAASVADALGRAMSEQAAEHPGMPDFGGQAGSMMRTMGGSMFGMQVGQAIGALAREAFGLSDIGVPLVAEPTMALVPANVAVFADGLETPIDEVRLFLAVREAAHARLFHHVPWLRGHLLAQIESYSRGIAIDTERIESAVRDLDLSDLESLRGALSQGVFQLSSSEAQERALNRLEASLALVEGWVDEVTAAATAGHLPASEALREMMRRRRAAGGPAEHTFATLVGLELRPRRARDAAELWHAVEAELGIEGRDGLWLHPDLLPEPEDLDEPSGFLGRREAARAAESDVDAAIAEILNAGDAPRDSGDEDGTQGDVPPATS